MGVSEQLRRLQEQPDFLERLRGNPEAQELLATIQASVEANPLLRFEPHPPNEDGSRPQLEFIEARTPVVAAFAGNRFGKSTALVVCALRELLDRDLLPSWLQASKRFDAPVDGWIVCPTDDKIYDSMMPALRKWCPPSELKGGNFDKGWNGARNILSFKNGSTLSFKTYKQDPSTLGGAELRFVGYDEPPPREHREESRMRLMGGGFEMFAMTPLKSNTGYVKRAIYKKREASHITVVKGSIHDNPTLDKQMISEALGDMSDLWRRAREFGDFVDVGGLIYPEFERCVVKEPWSAEFVKTLDHVVAIDPGIRNCGVVFEGFDAENVCHIFDELLLQDATPADYARAIFSRLKRWGLSPSRVHFVVDPAARSRGQTNAETVLTALSKEGIYANPGQNDVEAGIGQGRTRMAHGRLLVSPECRGLRDEADEYAAEEPREGKDDSHLKPVKSNDHRLDAARYGWMERFWDPAMEAHAPENTLGWTPGTAAPARLLRLPTESAPMGSLS